MLDPEGVATGACQLITAFAEASSMALNSFFVATSHLKPERMEGGRSQPGDKDPQVSCNRIFGVRYEKYRHLGLSCRNRFFGEINNFNKLPE